jgi:hypothetical protein
MSFVRVKTFYISLVGSVASAIWQERTGNTNEVLVDSIHALHSLHPSDFVWQQGAYEIVAL